MCVRLDVRFFITLFLFYVDLYNLKGKLYMLQTFVVNKVSLKLTSKL